MAGRIWVGTSGWNYKHWANGVFYPANLKQSDWLAFYSRSFDTVEINNTFYHLPGKPVFEAWRRITPDNFLFAIKASRFYTHMKKLIEPGANISRLLENARGLQEKLGIILFQLPGRWGYNQERLKTLFAYMDQQNFIPGLRSALEVRDRSWYNPECFSILEQHHVSLVLADQPGFASEGPITSDFVYLRRHGPGGLAGANYSDESIQRDAQNIRTWTRQGLDVYIYFNNDPFGFAVKNALHLKNLFGLKT